jgi:hypothetical protein
LPLAPNLLNRGRIYPKPAGEIMFKGLTRSLAIIVGLIVGVPYLIALTVQ